MNNKYISIIITNITSYHYKIINSRGILQLLLNLGKSILILDNAKYHHANIIRDYAFITRIDLLFLPPYSPELNPIERVWKLTKKHAIHNRYFQLLGDMKSALLGEFNKYFKPNDELKRLCVIT